MKKVVSSNWLLTTDVLEMVSEDTKGDVITSRAGKQKFSSHLSLAKVHLLHGVQYEICIFMSNLVLSFVYDELAGV